MKYILCFFALACINLNAQQQPKKNTRPKIKLASKKDLVCDMDMPKYLKDTLHYKGKIYGVCSEHCKLEIKKSPRKYIK